MLARKDARTLARDILGMTQEEFSRAFKNSPMKRAKLRGLKRTAAVVLGNVGTAEDVALLERVSDEEPDEMVREHDAWALARLRGSEAGKASPSGGGAGGAVRDGAPGRAGARSDAGAGA